MAVTPTAPRKKAIAMLVTLESARDPNVHRGALADVAGTLTNGGRDYNFIQPLSGDIRRKSAQGRWETSPAATSGRSAADLFSVIEILATACPRDESGVTRVRRLHALAVRTLFPPIS
jgi:hypothetical protein